MNLRAECQIYQYQVILLGYGGDGACGDRRDAIAWLLQTHAVGVSGRHNRAIYEALHGVPSCPTDRSLCKQGAAFMADVQVPVSGREATVFRSRSWRQPCADGFENGDCWLIEMPCCMDWPAATRRSGRSPEACVENGCP